MSHPDIQWRVHRPLSPDAAEEPWTAAPPPWLADVRRFRAEALYADGLRPDYRLPDGTFRDDDPCDPYAHHIVATHGGTLVASFRVVLLTATTRGICERLFGSSPLEGALGLLRLDRSTCCEVSGWAVHPDWRGRDIGMDALAAGSAVGNALGVPSTIGAAGTRYGQLPRLRSAGYECVPGVARVWVPPLTDDVQIVHSRFTALAPQFRERVDRMAALLARDSTPDSAGQLFWMSPSRLS